MTSGWGQESAVSADEARRGRLPPWRWQWGGSDLGGVAVEQSGVARGSAGPRLAGWALLEPQVLQDPLDHLRILDAGDDPHPSAAALALLDLDREHPLQALRPAHPCRRRRPTLLGSSPALARLIAGFIAAPRHDPCAPAMMRSEDPVKACEVHSGSRHQGGQAGEEIQRKG